MLGDHGLAHRQDVDQLVDQEACPGSTKSFGRRRADSRSLPTITMGRVEPVGEDLRTASQLGDRIRLGHPGTRSFGLQIGASLGRVGIEPGGWRLPHRGSARLEGTGLFVARGYLATTMGDIASATGVAVQTLYLCFGGKAALLNASFDVAVSGDDEPVALAERP